MLKILLIFFLLCLIAGYVGYRVLRFLTRVVQTVAGIHEEGQRNPRSGSGGPGSGPADVNSSHSSGSRRVYGSDAASAEKDITARARVIEEKPGAGG